MPTLTRNLDEVFSSPSSKSEDETFYAGINDDVQISSTSLASLLGLNEDGGRVEHAIVARHLWRALNLEESSHGAATTPTAGADVDEKETILLARRRGSAENASKMQRRFGNISANFANDKCSQSRAKEMAPDEAESVDGTLGGSPLRVDFASLDLPSELLDASSGVDDEDLEAVDEDLDWIEGLPLSAARQLASTFLLSKKVDEDRSNPSLWIACDGSDARKTLFLSATKTRRRQTWITTVSSRRVTAIDAHADVDLLLGEYRDDDDDDDADDGDDGGNPSASRYPSNIRVSAFHLQRMSVLDGVGQDEDHLHDFSVVDSALKSGIGRESRRRQMVVEVNSSWDSTIDKRLMQAPSVTDKMLDCQLHLTIGGSPKRDAAKLGQGQARLLNFYEDMKKLEAFLRGLTSGGRQLVWFPLPEESEEGRKPTLRRVEELLRSEARQTPIAASPTTPDANGEEDGDDSNDFRLDFVAKLWNILKRCDSSRQLQECLDRAVYGIVNASSIDALPTIFSISTSNVAKRIVATQRRLLNGDESLDGSLGKGSYRDDNPLIGLNPLLLLAELGIDKLRQEYHSISTSLLPQLPLDKLVSGSSMYGKDKSSGAAKFIDPKDRCLANFHRLVVSHYVVDCLVQIKTFFPTLNLEDAALKVAGVLRKQPPKNMGECKTVSLNISLAEDVKMERLESPSSWMMTTTSDEGRIDAIHVSPCKALPIKTGDSRSDDSYFLTRVSSVKHSL